MPASLSQRLFNLDGDANKPMDDRAVADMEKLLRDNSVKFQKIGWDYYDESLEIHGVPPDHRLPEAARKDVSNEGFAKIYVNHTDKWETHYDLRNHLPGWRVSYPHKRGERHGSIWVEIKPEGWPPEWFTTGYVIVKGLPDAADGS